MPFGIFAVRDLPSESLRFSPNELVFGHRVSCPLDVVIEGWSSIGSRITEPLLDFATRTRSCLHEALELADDNLGMPSQG